MRTGSGPPELPAFDPYGSRTDRDVRNRLSTGFIRSIETGDLTGLAASAEAFCPPDAGPGCRAYVTERMDRYRRAFARIRGKTVRDPIHRALVLWNEGLFFEVHEILETVWNGRERQRKEALRGLIQAAGAFVHRQRGAARAAEKLARRGAGHLREHRQELEEIENIEELIEALEDPGRPAPALQLRTG
jgi:hypothetical protein